MAYDADSRFVYPEVVADLAEIVHYAHWRDAAA
jgi:hypothetical protein